MADDSTPQQGPLRDLSESGDQEAVRLAIRQKGNAGELIGKDEAVAIFKRVMLDKSIDDKEAVIWPCCCDTDPRAD